MKTLFTLLSIGVFAMHADAQMTLNQSSYSSVSFGTDSFRLITNESTIAPPMFAASGFWNFSTGVFDPPDFETMVSMTATNPSFPTASFKTTLPGIVSRLGPFAIPSQTFCGITATAYERNGVVLDKQTYGIGSFTMVNTDSVWVPQQNIIFPSPETVIKFPATYGSTWSSTFNTTTNFTITATPLSIVSAAGVRKLYTVRTDSVKGWGKMRVKNKMGLATDSMNVLQVKISISTIDSMFISGAPAPSALLTAFGSTQGKKDTVYTTAFYRVNEIYPLAEILHRNNMYNDMKVGTVHQNRLNVPVSVNTVIKEYGIAIYPNPVTGRMVTIELKNTDHHWNYELINIMGQTVAQAPIAGKQTIITIDNSQPSGIYYLRMRNERNDVVTRAIDVVR